MPRHALARAAPAEGSPMDTRHAPESGAPDAPLPAHPPASYAPESPYGIFHLAKEPSVAKLTSGLSPASLQLAL
ncbi:poly-beta-hydroxybutyrate polymerase, partial [Burkholderia pseudomallei]